MCCKISPALIGTTLIAFLLASGNCFSQNSQFGTTNKQTLIDQKVNRELSLRVAQKLDKQASESSQVESKLSTDSELSADNEVDYLPVMPKRFKSFTIQLEKLFGKD